MNAGWPCVVSLLAPLSSAAQKVMGGAGGRDGGGRVGAWE